VEDDAEGSPIKIDNDEYRLEEIPKISSSNVAEKIERIYPGQQFIAETIVERHIKPILEKYHKKKFSDFNDIDFQVDLYFLK
jgi:hypothetical protein